MNRTVEHLLDQWLRYRLRIAVTVLCLIPCGLLLKAWIGSHYAPFHFALGPHLRVVSWQGLLTINPGTVIVGTARQDVELFQIAHWPLVLLFGALSALPWVQWSRRYNLRDFLIIATLIAISLGIAITSN